MDFFSAFIGMETTKKAPKKRSSLVVREGLVVKFTEKSLLFFDDEAATEVFIPLTQIRDVWFTSGTKLLSTKLDALEPDDEISILIPAWLARKEGLIK